MRYMPEIECVRVSTPRHRRDFIALPSLITPGYEGGRNYRQILRRRGNPLTDGGEYAPFLVYIGGRPSARAAAGLPAGSDRAFFSLFDSINDSEAAGALFEVIAGHLRAAGARTVVGPAPPDITGYGGWVLTGGFSEPCPALDADNPDWYAGLLEGCGFKRIRTFVGFSLDTAGLNKNYEGYARRLEARSRLLTRRMPGESDREVCTALMRVDARDGMARQMSDYAALWRALSRYTSGDFLHVARHGGDPVGYILTIQGEGGLRVATACVCREYRRRGALMSLAASVAAHAASIGARTIHLSTIDADNAPSIAAAEGAGGRLARVYADYEMLLT